MSISFATPHWEKISFERDRVSAAATMDPENAVYFPNDSVGGGSNGYFTVINIAWWTQTTAAPTVSGSTNITSNTGTSSQLFVNGTTIPARLHIPVTKHGGLWYTCDTLSDIIRQQLVEEDNGILYNKCMSHLEYSAEELTQNTQLDMLKSLSRSANACAIVSLITACTALALGSFAAAKQQIIFAVITGVCFGAAGLYTLFTVTLMQLRKVEVSNDEPGLPAVALAGRNVTSDWSLYFGWLSFFLSVAASVLWILMSMELKKSRQNYVFSSHYDQICSM